LIEWPADEREPTRYWLATLADDIAFERLVNLAKLRWRIERDYQELKQELGLGHYEGRSWRGFHHHATLCIAAYGFLISERETIPPSGPGRRRDPRGTCHTRRLPTQRRRRSGPNATCRTRSRRCDAASPSPSPTYCRAVLAAPPRAQTSPPSETCDAVRLRRFGFKPAEGFEHFAEHRQAAIDAVTARRTE
jgi:hypothetical protein